MHMILHKFSIYIKLNNPSLIATAKPFSKEHKKIAHQIDINVHAQISTVASPCKQIGQLLKFRKTVAFPLT